MSAFTREEFDIMVSELTAKEGCSFNMLCHIAEKTLKPSVRSWCYGELRVAKGHEEDIMQEILIRLIKETKSSFLLKNGLDAPMNLDYEGFRKWMFTVAKNRAVDYVKEHFRAEDPTDPEAIEEYLGSTGLGADVNMESRELLSSAFAIVLDSDASVYKVLTWVAQYLLMLCLHATKIESNELIVEYFQNRTLFQMRDTLFKVGERIPWLGISENRKKRVEAALEKPYKDQDRILGEVTYKELFMKKGGKATISDWVNRMNEMIRRVMKA